MAYTEYGDPDNPRVLVCVHGLSRVGADFDHLARALCQDYRVVCPDVVGRGASDWLANAAYYQTATYVADMVTLLARLNAGTLHWFGTSMGGVIGMALAALPATPIARMVLNDVGPVLTGAALGRISSFVGQTMHFDSEAAGIAYVRLVSEGFGPMSEENWTTLARAVLRPAADGGVRLHYDPAIGAAMREQVGPDPQDAVLWDLYDRITCPVLAVRGSRSDLLSAKTHAEMARRGPRAQLAVCEGIGHAPAFLDAEQIDLARQFLLQGGAGS